MDCPCESARRAALSKLIARREIDSDDPTYQKHFNEVKSAVDAYDAPSKDNEPAAQCAVITFACPHCSKDLEIYPVEPQAVDDSDDDSDDEQQ